MQCSVSNSSSSPHPKKVIFKAKKGRKRVIFYLCLMVGVFVLIIVLLVWFDLSIANIVQNYQDHKEASSYTKNCEFYQNACLDTCLIFVCLKNGWRVHCPYFCCLYFPCLWNLPLHHMSHLHSPRWPRHWHTTSLAQPRLRHRLSWLLSGSRRSAVGAGVRTWIWAAGGWAWDYYTGNKIQKRNNTHDLSIFQKNI